MAFVRQDRLDVDGQIQHMHFPHVRLNLSSGITQEARREDFHVWQTPEDFKREWRPPPPEEGFARTEQQDVEAVQVSPQKVHFIIRMSRRNASDEEYHAFSTLWIFVLRGGVWGVVFRSSFLDEKRAVDAGKHGLARSV